MNVVSDNGNVFVAAFSEMRATSRRYLQPK